MTTCNKCKISIPEGETMCLACRFFESFSKKVWMPKLSDLAKLDRVNKEKKWKK